jgi:DNA-binding response OmpR family regulator/predicted regulator of Ras-like GTPase activity (Roadblock/LC7/MglB family)
VKQLELLQVVVTMSDIWRICVVENDATLNQNLVNSLRKDGYVVQGVISSAEAMRMLWSEEYDVVICDLKLPGADGFELLRWLRAYRSHVRPIVLGDAGRLGDGGQRLQALESGALGYIDKPVDLRMLKDELRRLLQQTGFTASLDSFDLLDVIQIITMSRKSIALLINTGLEERGVLRFHNGDLVWAEYGVLRGEEAFFALAAHKNGTVTQQLSDGHFATNVTQPLSRLIFQALQYRTKYADKQQTPGQGPVGTGFAPVSSNASPVEFSSDDIDDSPFVFTSEGMASSDPASIQQMPHVAHAAPAFSVPQETTPPTAQKDLYPLRETLNTSPSLQGETATLGKDSSQMPWWLTDQPTSSHVPLQSPSQFSSSNQQTSVPPVSPSLSGEVRQIQATPSAQVPFRTTGELFGGQQSTLYVQPLTTGTPERRTSSPLEELQRPSSSPQHRLTGQSGVFEQTRGRPSSPDNNPALSSTSLQTQHQVMRKSYAALVSALQTLGYSLPGFVAAAVVDVNGQLIAQVAIDDTDISQTWQLLSIVQRSVLDALQSGVWGMYEETFMTTASRHVLMRAISSDTIVFLVLITTREANFTDSQEILANVEGAIGAALS